MAFISSVWPAFRWVALSIWATALFTCSMPIDCSLLAAAISVTMSVTRLTLVTISVSVSPDLFTRSVPASTFFTESWIRLLISLAAVADR